MLTIAMKKHYSLIVVCSFEVKLQCWHKPWSDTNPGGVAKKSPNHSAGIVWCVWNSYSGAANMHYIKYGFQLMQSVIRRQHSI